MGRTLYWWIFVARERNRDTAHLLGTVSLGFAIMLVDRIQLRYRDAGNFGGENCGGRRTRKELQDLHQGDTGPDSGTAGLTP